MTKRMLIDATHPEETRVVVMDGQKLVEYDYESQFRRQLKGNIFLAKVTRVEPSLQAAFVNFGGNRHGFLPFAEIHPDYYRIPVADREAMLAEQRAMEEAARAADDADDDADDGDPDAAPETPDLDDGQGPTDFIEDDSDEIVETVTADGATLMESDTSQGNMAQELVAEEAGFHDDISLDEPTEGDVIPDLEAPAATEADDQQDGRGGRFRRGGWRRGGHNAGRRGRYMGARRPRGDRDEMSDDAPIDLHGRFRRRYKIQEVIKRGQIMLIQVSKEERGNKGAAVTTYLSLPGRYCVLMPNSPRGGGVSRKIGNFADRKRLKSMLRALEIPSGMSVILRTAGVERSEAEIQRDYDYLQRLWNNIRELTLQSNAPALIYEEGDLIKRSIRDIYTRDVNELLIQGDTGYAEARDFMSVLMPGHEDHVMHYTDDKIPLFQRYQIESQINTIGEPVVQLKSGGYIVINQTEALVAVDVNSGRATKERHIEETALKTNLEAAEEIARQLRLRDLGGLVVIDFIDMEDRRNNAKVERRLKDALSNDRARIQLSRISTFGLLELSRQRLNPSLTEAQFTKCPHCEGFGYIRSIDNTAIMALRALEEEGVRARTNRVTLKIPNQIALYILNEKRDMLATIERRYGFKVLIDVDEALAPRGYQVQALKAETADEDEETTDDTGDNGGTVNTPRKRKPVLMEQALENPDEDGSTPDETLAADDDADAGTDDFNRADVEPDGQRPNGGRSGPRGGRGRYGRDQNRGPRGHGRHRADSPREDGGVTPDQSPRRDDEADGSSPRRGPRGNRRDRPNRGGDRPHRDHHRPARDPAPILVSNHDGAEAPVPPAGPSPEKPKATYFVAKRRSAAPDTAQTSPTSSAPAAAATAEPAPWTQPPAAQTPPTPSGDTGPKKKGWWSKVGL